MSNDVNGSAITICTGLEQIGLPPVALDLNGFSQVVFVGSPKSVSGLVLAATPVMKAEVGAAVPVLPALK